MSSYAASIGQDLLNVPMGDMIREMAFAIADAQVRLDENSIEVAEMMGGLKTIRDDVSGEVTFEDSRVFFGRERILLSGAITLHNSTNDNDLKAALNKELLDNYSGLATKTGEDWALDAPENDQEISIPTRLSMLELGFTPTFYQFVDTIIEVRIGITITQERSSEVKVDSNSKTVSKYNSFSASFGKGGFSASSRRSRTVTTTQVNATYASKYSYTAEGSSLLRTKLTPVPPPTILEDRIRQQMEILEDYGTNSGS